MATAAAGAPLDCPGEGVNLLLEMATPCAPRAGWLLPCTNSPSANVTPTHNTAWLALALDHIHAFPGAATATLGAWAVREGLVGVDPNNPLSYFPIPALPGGAGSDLCTSLLLCGLSPATGRQIKIARFPKLERRHWLSSRSAHTGCDFSVGGCSTMEANTMGTLSFSGSVQNKPGAG